MSLPLHRKSRLIIQSATDSQASAQVDQLNSEAKATREQCKNQIKQLFKSARGDRAQKTQVETAMTRFTGLLNEHQVVEKEFRKKVKDRVERQYKIVNPQATEEEIRQVTESDNPQVFSQAVRPTTPSNFICKLTT
jgi:syntaxin 1B/2/3